MLRRLLVPVLLLACLITPAVAQAGYQELLKDACRDEHVNGTYSQKDYTDRAGQHPDRRRPVHELPRRAAGRPARGGERAGGGPHGLRAGEQRDRRRADRRRTRWPTAGTPTEKQAVTQAGKTGSEPVKVGGEVVEPNTLGAGRAVAAGLSDLPAPLLAALSLIVLLGFRRDRLRPHPACPRPS